VPQQAQHGGQQEQRYRHGGRSDGDDGNADAEERALRKEHQAADGGDNGEAGREHGSVGCGARDGDSVEHGMALGEFLSEPLDREQRVVDAERKAHHPHKDGEAVAHRCAGRRKRAGGNGADAGSDHDRPEGHQNGNTCRHDGAEHEHEHDERHGDADSLAAGKVAGGQLVERQHHRLRTGHEGVDVRAGRRIDGIHDVQEDLFVRHDREVHDGRPPVGGDHGIGHRDVAHAVEAVQDGHGIREHCLECRRSRLLGVGRDDQLFGEALAVGGADAVLLLEVVLVVGLGGDQVGLNGGHILVDRSRGDACGDYCEDPTGNGEPRPFGGRAGKAPCQSDLHGVAFRVVCGAWRRRFWVC